MSANGYRASFWGDENVLELDRVIVAQLSMLSSTV